MRDVTDLMNNYRECSRSLWNTYFGAGKDRCGLDSVYEQIRKLLLEGLVTKQLDEETRPTSALIVVPMESLPILIRRPSDDGNYYWDQEPDLQAENDGTKLAFIDYYDFFQQPVKDFRFYRCRVLKFPRQPEYEGREALVDIAHARVFHGQ